MLTQPGHIDCGQLPSQDRLLNAGISQTADRTMPVPRSGKSQLLLQSTELNPEIPAPLLERIIGDALNDLAAPVAGSLYE